jgi:hypothetical protein
VPNEKVLSKEIIETTQKSMQADRERRELYKILRLPIS